MLKNKSKKPNKKSNNLLKTKLSLKVFNLDKKVLAFIISLPKQARTKKPKKKVKLRSKIKQKSRKQSQTNYLKEITSKKKSKGLILPLTFSYGLKLTIVKIRRKFLGKRWQYTSVALILLAIVTTTMLIRQHQSSQAATYSFSQTSWQASSTDTAVHPTNQDNWTSFYSMEGIATGTELSLIRESN
jgi:hypothetical protein